MVRSCKMRLRYPQLLAAALLALLSSSLHSAKRPPETAPAPPSLGIALGDPAVSLNGPWKFSPGDSPWTTNLESGVPIWTRAAFDDSSWATIDLTPAADSFGGLMNAPGWVPGWTRRGYPNLSGFAWYRIRLTIANPAQTLWLKMPGSFDDAYEIYANSQLVGSFGNFTANDLTPYYAQPASFQLPKLPPDGQLELALRVHMAPSTIYREADAGGLHGPPILGTVSTIQVLQTADRDFFVDAYFGDFLVAFFTLLALPLALWAFSRNSHERAWLWLTIALALQAVEVILGIAAGLTTVFSAAFADLWVDAILGPVTLLVWVLFWWSWFGPRGDRRLPTAAAIFTVAHMYARFVAISPVLGLDVVEPAHLQWFNIASFIAVTAQAVLLIVILNDGFRRRESEAIYATLPVLMLIFAGYTRYLCFWFSFPYFFRIFGMGFSATDFEQIVMTVALTAFAAHRFFESSIKQGLAHVVLEHELEQTHALEQQVLVPEDLHSTHFEVEASYSASPAIGGDFFMTSVNRDGSLCIVIGDVSGKGIGAAMLVAVLVGAARTRAAQDFDPIAMLQTLDERLNGHSGGSFATCLAAQLFPNGVLRVANAGHIPPYLNGCEIDLEGSLPLGFAGKHSPSKKQFQLRQGDILTFLTDGIPEAKNKHGELFGFEQARVLSLKSPAEIVGEVQAYGQDDDVTAIRVSFLRMEAIGPTSNLGNRQTVPA